jgi:ribosomal protein L37AE/L43A
VSYRSTDCPNCGRHRVWADGVCDKCKWDVDGENYVHITRPDEWRVGHAGIERYDKAAEEKYDAEWAKVFSED